MPTRKRKKINITTWNIVKESYQPGWNSNYFKPTDLYATANTSSYCATSCFPGAALVHFLYFSYRVAGSIGHIIKGALGSGVLSGHVAYMKGGYLVSIPLNVLCGIYMGFCLHMLVQSMQVLLKRTHRPFLSYSDTGEAALMLFPKPGYARFAKIFRYVIDALICLDLFGACASYQLIIAKSIKQLVENVHETSLEGSGGYPNLRVYLACLIPFIILICSILQLKILAPFSLVANVVIVFCIILAMYYCFNMNPTFSDLKPATSFHGTFEFIGMQVFSMSCSGIVIPIEGNMKDPKKFPLVLAVGMGFIIIATFMASFFAYVAFREDSVAPVTVNFPMTITAKCFKGAICLMIYVTHALNFWAPFNLVWYYLQQRHKDSPRIKMWERLYRAIIVIIIAMVAITFPNINALLGFLGTFCLSNMAFIWPNIIYLLVNYERPGYGAFKWRLWRSFIFIFIGFIIFSCGTMVCAESLFFKPPEK